MASEVAKRLRDRRMNVWNDAKKIAEDAANENRAFTPEEQGKWDAYNEEMTTLDTRIKAVLDTEGRAKQADDAYDALSGRKKEGPEGTPAQRDTLAEVRKWARGDEGASRALEIRHGAPGPINPSHHPASTWPGPAGPVACESKLSAWSTSTALVAPASSPPHVS